MNRLTSHLAAAVLPVLVLAGCAGARFADVANLTDPRTIVDDSVNGKTLTLRQGSALVVRLPVTAGDGNRWELAPLAVTPLGSPVRMDYVPVEGVGSLASIPPYSGVLERFNPPGSQPPAIVVDASRPAPLSAQGETVLRLRGTTPGTATVQLDYRREDQPGAPASRSVRFDVAVVK